MPRYAVLLRGINVGSAKRVAMADLRELLTEAGFEDVRTHLNSGNVVLTGKSAPPKRIEKAITDRTGLSVASVSRIELARGTTRVNAEKFARALGIVIPD